MCEVESQGTTGNGMVPSPLGRLNVSCPEDMTGNKRQSLEITNLDPSDGTSVAKPTEGEPLEGDLDARRRSVGTREPLGVAPRKHSIAGDSVETEEGVDPFKPTEDLEEEVKTDPKDLLQESTTPLEDIPPFEGIRRDSKTVSFKEPESENVSENGTANEVSSTNSSTGSKGNDGVVERKRSSSGKQRSLGENNPVYRLSMKLSPNLFNIQEIPGATQHREPEKAGYLTKLSGRSFPYIAQWKRRYCVLAKGRLYYYEREDSKPGEKGNGVINLEYFDQVTEAGPKDCKKATNVFIITSQDRSFFDPGRHLFSADTLPDMKDWVRKLQSALEQIRNNNRPAATSPSPSAKKDGGKKGKEEQQQPQQQQQQQQLTESKENAQNSTKDRKKKKDSHRSRKSARVADGPETPANQGQDSSTPVTSRRETDLPMMASSVGVQLPGMTSVMGVGLPGLSPTKKEPTAEETKERTMTTTTSDSNQPTDEGLPSAGPTLTSITKKRNKGPQGRRAPQNRRTMAATSLKKRASSLSALEYQDLNDNSEAPWLNRSLDMLDEANDPRNGGLVAGCPPKLPYKAYNYSTDEDTDNEGEYSLSDSLPTSAAAMPPPPPPRSASYGLELRQNPQLGQVGRQVLHRSLGDAQGSGGDMRGSKRSLGDGRMYGQVGEWRGSSGEQWIGSHSSLGQNGEIIGSASPVMDDLDNMLMNESIHQTSLAIDSASESGSDGSTCRPAGQQKPRQAQVNHHHQPASKQSKHRHHHKKSGAGPDLTRFAMAVKHLQRHVVEIDRSVFGITGEVTGTRQEVTTLKEAVLALQADTDTITSTLSHLTEEAISAQQKITFASQEAEKVRKIANVALKEAEQAKQEHLKHKREYEILLEEVKSTFKTLKDSQSNLSHGKSKTAGGIPCKEAAVAKGQDTSSDKGTISKANIEFKNPEANFRPADECLRSSSPMGSNRASQTPSLGIINATESSIKREPAAGKLGEDSSKPSLSKSAKSTGESLTNSFNAPKLSGSLTPVVAPTSVTKSSSYTQVSNTPKVPAYQSLFARPSSLMSSLTQRSLTKSVSFADQNAKDKAQENTSEATVHKESSEKSKKEEKHQTSLERKEKKDSKSQRNDDKKHTYDTNSKERKTKDKKDSGSIDRRERKHRHSSKDKRNSHRGSIDEEHMISNLSLEDIPMADDNSNELLDRFAASDKKETVGNLTSLSNSTQTPSNFSLGKSSSSPVVLPGFSANMPKQLLLTKDQPRNDLCSSNVSTPDSSMPPYPFPQAPPLYSRPTSPSSRSSTALPTVEENLPTGSSLTSMHRPGSTPGPLSRQGSMTTVPENRAVPGPPPSRPGVFAISRQNSSPNLPTQRQNSGVSIPLQRQHSLGTVPEGGRLARQNSLMSVPENRPLADQTLPLSPSQSMNYFPISPSASASMVSESVRRAAIASMELVTGPVLAGSSMQEASATGTLAVLPDPDEEFKPAGTSTLKKDHHKPQRDVDGVAI